MASELKCRNCGGNIDPISMKCPYCGTVYERDADEDKEIGKVRVEENGHGEIDISMMLNVCQSDINEIGIYTFKNEISKLIAHEMIDEIAKQIELRFQQKLFKIDIYECHARLKIIKPQGIGITDYQSF